MIIACHHRHVCTVQKHTPFSVCNRTPSPIWLKCHCFQLPPRPPWSGTSSAVRGLPRGQVCLAPWAAQGPVSVTLVSRVCSVTMVALVACTPSNTGGFPALYQCGVASTQCGGIGLLRAGIPLYQVTLLAFSPRCATPTVGSLVTPSVCLDPSLPCVSLCLPVPVCVMCDVTTCAWCDFKSRSGAGLMFHVEYLHKVRSPTLKRRSSVASAWAFASHQRWLAEPWSRAGLVPSRDGEGVWHTAVVLIG